MNDIQTIERNADVLLNACKDISLVVNIGKTKYKEAGHYWGIMANEHIVVDSNPYVKIETIRYADSLLANQNSIHEEIICRLQTGNSCYSSVQTFLSS